MINSLFGVDSYGIIWGDSYDIIVLILIFICINYDYILGVFKVRFVYEYFVYWIELL